jgi:hypothetical protein
VSSYHDLVIADQADEIARLVADNAALLELVADLAFEGWVARDLAGRQLRERIYADAQLNRIRSQRRHEPNGKSSDGASAAA